MGDENYGEKVHVVGRHNGENENIKRADEVEADLRIAIQAAEDIRALKHKCKHLMERLLAEKSEKEHALEEAKIVSKKSAIFVDHIEKLMYQLHVLSKGKMKYVEAVTTERTMAKKNSLLIKKQSKIIQLSKKTIREISEGSELLENQLRLMDEKYAEIRVSLGQTQK